MGQKKKSRNSKANGNGHLGSALKDWRIDHDLPIAAVASKLNRSIATIWRWEKGSPIGERSRRQIERLIGATA